jgi:hypothetical protein
MTGKVSKFQAVLSSREVSDEPKGEEAIDFVENVLPASSPAIKMGRPKGKRSNPDYTQVTAYIRQDTYKDIRVLLLQKGDGQEFSELVEELLSEYLKTQTFSNSKV